MEDKQVHFDTVDKIYAEYKLELGRERENDKMPGFQVLKKGETIPLPIKEKSLHLTLVSKGNCQFCSKL